MVIYGSQGTAEVDISLNSTAKDAAAAINNKSADSGVTATATTSVGFQGTAGVAYTLALGSDNSTAINVAFKIGSGSGTADDYAAAISAFNAQSAKTGVTASYDADAKGLKLTNASGNDIKLAELDTAADGKIAAYDGAGAAGTFAAVSTTAATPSIAKGTITLDSSESFSATDTSGFGLAASSNLKKVSDIDVGSFANAQQAIKIADAALAKVNDQRAQLGALQSRFSSAISNLQSSTENLSASRSRIVDTDFASETANMTRGQILQQAGTSMLAQANSLPNGVMSLLRG